MSNTVEQLKEQFADFVAQYDQFSVKGTKVAGTRARKALLEIGKLTKAVRSEIQTSKNAG